MTLYVIIFIAVSALFLPITVRIKTFADFGKKKIFYTLFIPANLRINSGYVGFTKNAVVIHFSDKKAYAIDYKAFKPNKNATDMLFRLNFTRVKGNILLKNSASFCLYCLTNGIRCASAAAYAVMKEDGRYTDFRLDVTFTGENGFDGALNEIVVALNLFALIEAAVYKLFGGKKNA